MKKFTQLCLWLMVATWLPAQTVIFVKSNATGANNGTSWANAYTSLENALASAAPSNQIWAAAGTYKSTGIAPNNSFFLLSGVELYGGFSGIESLLSQRNIALNETILSGDIQGDDIDGDFSTNRTDNAVHVVRTQNGNAANRAIIDGVTIKGGNTSTVAADPEINRRGGGIYVEAKTTVRNCLFTNNRAESGGSIMVPGVAGSGLVVTNCRFEKNDATTRAAGIYFINLTSAEIRKCVFENNTVSRGCVYPRTSVGVVIDSCSFNNNVDNFSDGFGAGIFAWQTTYKLTNCNFSGNTGGSAVCVYSDNREGGKFAEILNCRFENNIATNYGGTGFQSYRQKYRMENCSFVDNIAPSSAAAIYNSDSLSFEVKNTLFEGNEGNYAAAVANYGIDCVGTFDGCTFRGNKATNGGGACSSGFKSNVTYKNCLFDGNQAMFGGALFTQNDTTRLTIDGCTFTENGAETTGGAVFQNANIAVDIDNSTFKVNSANIGGCIYAEGDSAMTINNTIFIDNLGLEQAAGVYIINGNVDMTNCLVARNLNVGTGAAGGVHNNAGGGLTSTLKMTNCTIVDNLASLGAGFSQWEDSDSSSAVAYLQNCLIQNPNGINYEPEAGTPEIISLGGNQSSDESLAIFLVVAKDTKNTTNEFVDADNGDYHLVLGPAVNGGIATGAPTTDLDGNPRQGDPDSGCYELASSSTQQPSLVLFPLQITPNPATIQTVLSLKNAWTGKAALEIVGTDGRLAQSLTVNKISENWQYTLNINALPVGTYQVYLRGEGHLFRGTLVKQ
jgi:hypothetical protein